MMIIILSPSKTLDLRNSTPKEQLSTPAFQSEAKKLMATLRKMKNLGKVMKLSDDLATTVKQWHSSWSDDSMLYPTGASMKGEAFKALGFDTLDSEAADYAKNRMFVLSGLYGALKPLDGVNPYRLEMAQKFTPYDDTKSLNGFWAKRLPEFFNQKATDLGITFLANLASDEYNKVVLKPELDLNVINFSFKVETDSGLKNISVFAKQARGAMARFIIENKIESPEGLRAFEGLGFRYREDLSDSSTLAFTRTR